MPRASAGLGWRSLPNANERAALTGFFFWSAWAAATGRPGVTGLSYTSNWPSEPLAGNSPSAGTGIWSIASVMYVATQAGRLVTIQEIAVTHRIPKNHLTKVVHRLSLAGLAETVRGRTGGVRLARDPSTITVGAVVRLTEPDFTMVECFDETRNACRVSPVCVLKPALGQATRAYLEELDRVSLASMLPRPGGARIAGP